MFWSLALALSFAPTAWIARACLSHKGPWGAFEATFLAVMVGVSLAISGCAIYMGVLIRGIAILEGRLHA